MNLALARQSCRFLILASGLLLAGITQAQISSTNSLEQIRSRGHILLGFREDAVPFSYLDASGRPIGFAIDLCHQVIEAIKSKFKLPELKVFHLATTQASHQVMLESGGIDLYCGNAVNTAQKQRAVAFGVTTYVAALQALTLKDAGIAALADLEGKTIVTVAGSTSEAAFKATAIRQGLTPIFRNHRDDADTLRLLNSGHAAALILSDVDMRKLMLSTSPATRENLALLPGNYGYESYALEFRRQDPAFKRLIDDTLVHLMKNGEFIRIYQQWFTAPLPTIGGNLELPMSEILKQLLLTPNDHGM